MPKNGGTGFGHGGGWEDGNEGQDSTRNMIEEEAFYKQDQRRLRHLTAIHIKNLTLNPKRDEISSFLSLPLPSNPNPPPSKTAVSTTGPGRRRTLQFASDDTDLYLRTRRRATSNASLRPVLKAPTIEELSGESAEDSFATSSSSTTTETPAFPFPGIMRRRSTSRASIASLTSNGSGSTIRAPVIALDRSKLDEGRTVSGVAQEESEATLMEEVANGRVSFASEALLVKEKRRREEMLRRRLVSCFVSLSIPPPEDVDSVEKRKRGMSTSGNGGRGKLARNNSSSASIKRSRRSTLSTSNFPSSASPPTPPPPPFYISRPSHAKVHPTFDIDNKDFLVDDPEDWEGLRLGRVTVGVWVASGSQDGGEKADDWKLLLEWDVEFSGLVTLGKDPQAFPPLPPNTLIFAINSNYYTERSHSFIPPLSFNYSSSSPDEASDDDGNISDPGINRFSSRGKKSDQGSRRVT